MRRCIGAGTFRSLSSGLTPEELISAASCWSVLPSAHHIDILYEILTVVRRRRGVHGIPANGVNHNRQKQEPLPRAGNAAAEHQRGPALVVCHVYHGLPRASIQAL